MFRTKTPFEGSVEIKCRHCGNGFFTAPGFSELIRYCSKQCQKKANNLKQSHEPGDQVTDNNIQNSTDMDLSEKLFNLQQDYSDLKLKYSLMERDYSGFQDLKKTNQELQAAVNDLTRDYTTEKGVSDRQQLVIEKLEAQVVEMAAGFIISGSGGKIQIPAADFARNIKNDARFTKEGSFEMRILNRWTLRKKAGSLLCDVIKL